MDNYNNFDDIGMRDYMLSRPDSVFAMFTHMDGNRLSPDYLIRVGLSKVYGVPIDNTFSHTGIVWAEDGELWYWHQTWPHFKRDRFRFRRYNVIIEVDDYEHVQVARSHANKLLDKKSGYGIGTLLNFAFSIWFSWMGNAIRVGKVCSGAVAKMLEGYIMTGRHRHVENVDPQYAHNMLVKAGLRRWEIDRR